MRAQLQDLASAPELGELDALVGGDLVATPTPRGRRLVVAFRGTYELLLTDGEHVFDRHLGAADQRALIFVVRRVPVLYAALEQSLVLVLDEVRLGHYAAVDLYHREEECYLAHGELLNRISRLDLLPATFAAVPPPRHEAELARTLTGLSALGDALEVRREEDGVVVARAGFDRRAHAGRVR